MRLADLVYLVGSFGDCRREFRTLCVLACLFLLQLPKGTKVCCFVFVFPLQKTTKHIKNKQNNTQKHTQTKNKFLFYLCLLAEVAEGTCEPCSGLFVCVFRDWWSWLADLTYAVLFFIFGVAEGTCKPFLWFCRFEWLLKEFADFIYAVFLFRTLPRGLAKLIHVSLTLSETVEGIGRPF